MHWGVEFEEGKIYQISDFFEQQVEVITEYDTYYQMRKSLEIVLAKDQVSLTDPRVVDFFDQVESLRRKFSKKITLPFVSIYSENKSLHTFCTLNDKDISEKYNIVLKPNGEIPFVNTATTLYKNFDYISDIRNNKLNDLGIG